MALLKKVQIGTEFNYNFTNKPGKYTVRVQITDQLGDVYTSKSLNFEVYRSRMTKPIIASTNSYITNNSTIQQQTVGFNTLDSTDVVSYEWSVISNSGTRTYYTSSITFNPIEVGTNKIQVTTRDIYNDPLTSDVFTVNVESPMQTPVIVSNPSIASGAKIAKQNISFAISNNTGVQQYLWVLESQSGTTKLFTTPTISFNPIEEGMYSLTVIVTDNYGRQLRSDKFLLTVHQHTSACYVHQHTAACYSVHYHSGDATNGGACYTYAPQVICGQPLTYVRTDTYHDGYNSLPYAVYSFDSVNKIFRCSNGHEVANTVFWYMFSWDMWSGSHSYSMNYPPSPDPVTCQVVISGGYYYLSCGKVEGQSYLTCGKTENLTLICGYQ